MRYRTLPIPMERLAQIELLRAVSRKPIMHGLFEADVARPRALLRDLEGPRGERLSFTAFLVGCLARAVAEQPEVQAFRLGRRRMIMFDGVDVATLVEVEDGVARVPVFHVVRDADRKRVAEIHEEIRAAAGPRAAPLDRLRGQIRRLRWIPRPARALMWRALGRAPRTWRRYGGTVVLTSVGMFGSGPGWGISVLGGYPLGLTVGGIGDRLVLVDDRPTAREHLSLTLSVDHEILDGAPAARFASRLRELIERAHGLTAEDGRAREGSLR
jgi:pyruvate/2-oxoglutarate dehydrogenase complex dihydrolipoamide acyltransferase (E2) component